MTRQITITTGARLHFGLLANAPSTGRNFGGAGLMIASPRFRLVFQEAESDVAVGPDEPRRRVANLVARYRAAVHASVQPPACHIEIQEAIPSHIGLGSGTQLGMAIAQGLALWSGEVSTDATALAHRIGRGTRSALGIHGFAHGGCLVDGGKQDSDRIAPLIARAAFPIDWRFVLMTPSTDAGLHGDAETAAFARLAPMPRSTTERLCRILLMELLPAVLEAQFNACGEALYEFGRTAGEYFSPVQGGPFAQPQMADLTTRLRHEGVRGVGQTSWGPTLFALCDGDQTASQLSEDLRRWSVCHGCQVRIAVPLNAGARVESI